MQASVSSAELDDLFYRLPAALYRTSTGGRVLAANHATADLLGYESPAELLAVEDAAVVAHVDPDMREVWRRELDAQGILRDFQVRLRRKDGSPVWVRDTARAIYDDDGEVRFYEGVLTDITTEVGASSSSSFLSGVLESTTDLVVVFDSSRSLRYANGAARSYLGISQELILTRPRFEDVITGAEWNRKSAFGGSRGWSGEVTVADRNGRPRPLWVVVTRHRGRDQETYVAAIARDLTQVKSTQSRLEELVTAKDVFVASVSHELRTPLTGVVGLAEELRDGYTEFGEQERQDLISLIAHQASEMTSLVEDLLVAVRSDVADVAVVPEAVDVPAEVSSLRSVTSDAVEWEIPNEPLLAWADPQRLRQIVRNLISNAQRHGGERIRVRVVPDTDGVAVEVSDDGHGVPDGDAEKIFEPFQRADQATVKRGSVGLGLSVSRRLARLMGGDIDYSYDGDWATFRVTLPPKGLSVVARET